MVAAEVDVEDDRLASFFPLCLRPIPGAAIYTDMDGQPEALAGSGIVRIRRFWNEHRLLCYAALLGIVGGLGAHLS